MNHFVLMLITIKAAIAAAYMSDTIETMMVVGKGGAGPFRINVADYDKAIHGAEYKGKDAIASNEAQLQAGVPQVPVGAIIPPAPSAPNFTPAGPEAGGPTQPNIGAAGVVAPSNPSPNQAFVIPIKGNKFQLIDTSGAVIDDPAIKEANAKGYKTEQEAIEAIKLLPH